MISDNNTSPPDSQDEKEPQLPANIIANNTPASIQEQAVQGAVSGIISGLFNGTFNRKEFFSNPMKFVKNAIHEKEEQIQLQQQEQQKALNNGSNEDK